ncbi:MAG: prepilin peptidase [Candidatus Gastranaerophilales bacterium]|nr:prepilin peptidase [Candidatus Gastranaerophilales bacterium]
MIDLNTLVAVFVFVIGACIGSFLNVVALRGLSGESIVFPPSKCPKCNNKLNWYTNIPIISYCFLGGKCQFCKEHISIQYPVVEFLNALLWLFCFLEFGYTAKTLFLCILASLFIVNSITEFKKSVVIDANKLIIIDK